jgi:hypothetical protein
LTATRTNCSASFTDVAAAAKYYYRKLYPDEITDDNERAFHNTPSFNERYEMHWQELREETDNHFYEHATINDVEEQEYINALNDSFDENREIILERLSKKVDLTQTDPIRFGKGAINLCHECLCPYNQDELAMEGIRLLCTRENPGEESCHKAYLERIAERETPRSAWDD